MGKKTKKRAAVAAPKAVAGPLERYVSKDRVQERLAQGWKVVEGPRARTLRNGSVLMEKPA